MGNKGCERNKRGKYLGQEGFFINIKWKYFCLDTKIILLLNQFEDVI